MIRLMMLVIVGTMLAGAVQAVEEFDDAPAAPREWGFRPFEEEVSRRNPPGFSWRQQQGARSYVLQIARDAGFADIVYEAEEIELFVHCPTVTLPVAERLYWRVAFVGEEQQSAWSRVRSFTIDAAAVDFPLPGRQELLARLPDEHPRLFVRPEQLPELRALARGELSERYEALVRQSERILEDPPPTQEPEKYPAGIRRGSDEWRSIWWGNRTYTIAVLDSAATLGFTWLLDGKEEYGQMARKLLMAAAEWDPVGATGYRYNDEAGMPYNYLFSRTYTYVYDLLTEAEREKCRAVMRVRGEEMYRHLYPRHLRTPYGSHANRAWHFLGEVAIAFLGEVEGAEEWLWFATNVFFNAYPVWSDDEGGWHEGTAYWSSYLNRFTWWADVQRVAFGIDAFKLPFFSNAGDFGIYAMPPNVPHGGFGDLADRRNARQNRGLMTIFANQAQDGYWLDYAYRVGGPSYTGGYIGFIRGALPEFERKCLSKLPSSKLFKGTGLAYLHSDLTDARHSVQVSFKSSPFGSQSHGYEAQNAFLLFAYGQALLINTGRRDSHGSTHHREWMWSTRSVNSITISGQDQIRHNAAATGEIIAFETSDAFDYVAGEAADAYPEGLVDQFTRHILFAKPDVVIILDELRAPEPQTFEWWLHSPEAMELNGQHDIRVSVGDAAAHVNMLAPEGLGLSQTDQFDPPPRERIQLTQWHLMAETPEPANAMRFVTVIRPHREGEQPPTFAETELRDDYYAVRAKVDDGELIAVWRLSPGEVTAMGLTTDGEVAAMRVSDDGEPGVSMVHEGTRVDFQGR